MNSIQIYLLGIIFAAKTLQLYCYKEHRYLDDWIQYKKLHNKTYENEEEDFKRFQKYLGNQQLINRHNYLYEMGKVSYKLKINHLGDRFDQEIRHKINIFGIHPHELEKEILGQQGVNKFDLSAEKYQLPDIVDWRLNGSVQAVRNQWQCGACWAFSTVAAIESHLTISTGETMALSEQNLVDCAKGSGYEDNHGCQGGNYLEAFKYVINNGLDTRDYYLYWALDTGSCKYKKEKVGASIKNYKLLTDENTLKNVVAMKGPVAVSIDAHADGFIHYAEGIYSDPSCDANTLTHGVTVIGYGTDNGVDYWLIRNSWGEDWGEKGYMKLARNENNMCGVATLGIYPVDVKLGHPSSAKSWSSTSLLVTLGITLSHLFRK